MTSDGWSGRTERKSNESLLYTLARINRLKNKNFPPDYLIILKKKKRKKGKRLTRIYSLKTSSFRIFRNDASSEKSFFRTSIIELTFPYRIFIHWHGTWISYLIPRSVSSHPHLVSYFKSHNTELAHHCWAHLHLTRKLEIQQADYKRDCIFFKYSHNMQESQQSPVVL